MSDSNSTPTHEQISRRAYEIFIERGQPEGQDLAHWLEAERQLRASGQTKSNSAQITSAPSTNTAAVRATAPATPATSSASSSRSNGRPRAAARK